MTTKTYDTKPAFDPNKPYEPIAENKPAFDANKSFEPVKKKDVGVSGSKTSSMGGTTAQKPVIDPANGLEVLQSTPEQDALYERMMQRASQVTGETPNLDDDPIGNVTKPYKDKALTVHNELRTLGSGNRNVSESTGQNKKVEARKDNMQSTLATDSKKSFQELQDVTNHLSNSLFPNGKEAGIYLQRKAAETGGELPQNNQTVEIAKNKAAKYEYLKDILSKGSLDQMAVEVMRQNDPNLDKQISVLEQAKGGTRAGAHGYQTPQDIYQNIIPAVQQARYIDEMLHDPDVKIIAQEDPKVKADFDKLSNGGLYEIYPEYGEVVVRNRLSRAREQAGRNNIIANPIFNSSKYMDKLAEKEFADEPVLLNIYNQRLKGNLEGKIDTPGIVDEFGTGAKHTYQQMGNTIADVMGLGKTEDERIYSQLENQYGNVNSGVTGVRKNVGTASNFLGMMGAMGSLGAPLRVTGLTGNAANAVITADAFYDSELNNWTMKYPGEPWKAQTGAITSTALFAAGQKAFPSTKVADAIVGKMEPAIQDAVNKLNEGAVEKAVRDNLVKKFGSVLKETVKGTAEATTHMVAISAFQNAMDHVLGLDDKTMSKYHPDNEIVDVAKNMIIGSAFPQFMMAYGNRNGVANALYSIPDNRIRLSEILTRQAEENPSLKPEIDKKLADIEFLSQTKKLLDEHNVTPDNQKRYLLEAMNEKYATDKAKNTADKTLSDQSKDSIKESQEIKEGILAGQNADEVMTTKKVDAEKEKVKAEADRNKLIEKGHTAIDKLLEEKDENEENVFKGMYRDIAKKDPVGFLEDIAGQINGVQRKEGDKVESDQLLSDLEHKLIKKYGADIVNVAKELFPYKEPISSKISVQMPEEVENQRREVTTIAPKPLEPTLKNENATEGTEASPEVNEQAQAEQSGEAAKLTIEEPETAEVQAGAVGGDKKTGIKNVVSRESRVAFDLPKVELPKIGSDYERLSLGKQAVDSGKVNPQEVVDRVISGKGKIGMQPEEAGAMQYYMHQLGTAQDLVSKQIALDIEPVEKLKLVGQQQQLSDLMDAATEANMLAGTAWSDVGNTRQILVDQSFNPSREKAIIKDAYGGEVPKDVQLKIDTAIKERDDAIAHRNKVEELLREKEAALKIAEMKTESKKSSSSTPKEKKDYKAKRDSLLDDLKAAKAEHEKWMKDNGIQGAGASPFVLTNKMIGIIGKIAGTYVEQGIDKASEVITKVYDDVKGHLTGISRQDVRDAIALHGAQKMDRTAQGKENKIAAGEVKPDISKLKMKFQSNTDWVKANQRIANADFKIKTIKRLAFESKKNFYQKGLMWAGRMIRLSVLSGYNVLGKLASAATIGAAVKRIPEQAIGKIYSTAFKGIAEKAPIEGYVNAKSEAKFYKEFFDPKKFAHNSWQILKTGASDLSKKMGSAEYEHVPILYIPTDLHQIIKDPVKRATFEASFRNGLVWAEKNGLDINDNLVINSLENAAYKRAQYEIFQESNKLSRAFGEWKGKMEKSGNAGATGKFLADFMIPVSTVPTNIVRRIVTTSPLGLIRGSKMVVDAYREGIENLTSEQADAVMKQLKQGSLGTALWMIGWFGSSYFGGLYSKYNPDKKRKEGELMHDEMQINGKSIPKPTQHALPLEIIQFAATARHVYDHYKNDPKEGTVKAVENAGLGSIGALLEQIPVIETGVHAVEATGSPYEGEKLKDDIKRRFQPQILRETGIIKKEEKPAKKKERKHSK